MERMLQKDDKFLKAEKKLEQAEKRLSLHSASNSQHVFESHRWKTGRTCHVCKKKVRPLELGIICNVCQIPLHKDCESKVEPNSCQAKPPLPPPRKEEKRKSLKAIGSISSAEESYFSNLNTLKNLSSEVAFSFSQYNTDNNLITNTDHLKLEEDDSKKNRRHTVAMPAYQLKLLNSQVEEHEKNLLIDNSSKEEPSVLPSQTRSVQTLTNSPPLPKESYPSLDTNLTNVESKIEIHIEEVKNETEQAQNSQEQTNKNESIKEISNAKESNRPRPSQKTRSQKLASLTEEEKEKRKQRAQAFMKQLETTTTTKEADVTNQLHLSQQPQTFQRESKGSSKKSTHRTLSSKVLNKVAPLLPSKETLFKRRGSLEMITIGKSEEVDTLLSERWNDFAQSLPKKEKKSKSIPSPSQKFVNDGDIIIGALLKSNQKKDETELPIELPTPPIAPPIKNKEVEKVNILNFANTIVSYDEIFGTECQDESIFIWRIEKKCPSSIPREDYGIFYRNDTYLILLKYDSNESSQKTNDYQIYIWIGKNSSVDKIAIGAIRAIELNKYMGDKASQFRIEEGQESEAFLSIFPEIFEVRDGGTENTFRNYSKEPIAISHIKQFDLPRLYCIEWRIKEKKSINITLVECSKESLNKTDIFLLDTGSVLYVWGSPSSDSILAFMTITIANTINIEERNNEAEVEDLTRIINQSDERFELFWNLIKSNLEEVKEKTHSFDQSKLAIRTNISESGSLELNPLNNEDPITVKKEWLESSHCIILDCYSEIFLWLGKQSSAIEKKLARDCLSALLKCEERPSWVVVENILEGAESILFKKKFDSWTEPKVQFRPLLPIPIKPPVLINSEFPPEPIKRKLRIDIKSLFFQEDFKNESKEPSIIPEVEMEGNSEIWILDKIGPTFLKIPNEERSHFFSEDTYMILYTFYAENDEQRYVAYFWEGQDASQKWWGSWSTGFFPGFEKKVLSSGSPLPEKFRIFQRKEPKQFARLFNNIIIVHKGKRKDGVKKKRQGYRGNLYHVRSYSNGITRAIEVEAIPSRLNSNDFFLFATPSTLFVWKGKKSNEDIITIGKVVKLLDHRNVVHIVEGEEPNEFWEALGPKVPYLDSTFHDHYTFPLKLFSCSTKSGEFAVERLSQEFVQTDITLDKIFFLDTYYEIYYTVGNDTTEIEKDLATQTVKEYAKHASSLRKLDVTVIDLAKLPVEPWEFTRHFHAWNIRENLLDPRQLSYIRYLEQEKMEQENKAQEKLMAKENQLISISPTSSSNESNKIVSSTPKLPRCLVCGFKCQSPMLLEISGMNFHPKCFTCKKCNKQMKSSNYTLENETFSHQNCDEPDELIQTLLTNDSHFDETNKNSSDFCKDFTTLLNSSVIKTTTITIHKKQLSISNSQEEKLSKDIEEKKLNSFEEKPPGINEEIEQKQSKTNQEMEEKKLEINEKTEENNLNELQEIEEENSEIQEGNSEILFSPKESSESEEKSFSLSSVDHEKKNTKKRTTRKKKRRPKNKRK